MTDPYRQPDYPPVEEPEKEPLMTHRGWGFLGIIVSAAGMALGLDFLPAGHWPLQMGIFFVGAACAIRSFIYCVASE